MDRYQGAELLSLGSAPPDNDLEYCRTMYLIANSTLYKVLKTYKFQVKYLCHQVYEGLRFQFEHQSKLYFPPCLVAFRTKTENA